MQVTFGSKDLYLRRGTVCHQGISTVNKKLDGLYLKRDIEKGSSGFSWTSSLFKILRDQGKKIHIW